MKIVSKLQIILLLFTKLFIQAAEINKDEFRMTVLEEIADLEKKEAAEEKTKLEEKANTRSSSKKAPKKNK